MTNRKRSFSTIAIAGGGIAGLALARQLQSSGIVASIFEQRSDALHAGLAVNLPGNAVRALGALGLGDALSAASFPLRRREYRSSKDRLLFAIDEDAFWGPAARPQSVTRSALLRMLADGLDIHWGDGVRSIAMNAEAVDVGLADGSTSSFDLIVGADGVRSVVREQVFGSSDPAHAVLAQASWRFMTRNPGVDCWTLWAGSDALVLLMPTAGGMVYGWIAGTRSLGSSSNIEQLLRQTETFPQRVREAVRQAISSPDGLYHSPLEEVRLPNWTKQRAVLIGDAAHATAPVWAQGVALALEDALVLAECIDNCDDGGTALQSYENLRRPRVQHVKKMTDTMSKAARLPIWLRNTLMPVIGPLRYRQTYGPLMGDL